MLMRCPEINPEAPRNLRRERALWHDEGRHTPLLGCTACPERTLCGGLAIGAGAFDCLSRCCGRPAGCDKVCRLHPDFADRVREVQTFGLENVPRGPILPAPVLAGACAGGVPRQPPEGRIGTGRGGRAALSDVQRAERRVVLRGS